MVISKSLLLRKESKRVRRYIGLHISKPSIKTVSESQALKILQSFSSCCTQLGGTIENKINRINLRPVVFKKTGKEKNLYPR